MKVRSTISREGHPHRLLLNLRKDGVLKIPMDITYRVTGDDAHRKVSQILCGRLQFSRGEIRRLKRNAGVSVNALTVRLNHLVREGDLIQINLQGQCNQAVIPQDIPLSIAYEDQHLLVVDKPAGMLVHPLSYHLLGTLANGVIYHFLKQGLNTSFRAVNRLDKDTSGLLLIAKSSYVCQQLAGQIASGLCQRKYLAVVHNHLTVGTGVIDLPIGRPYEDSLIFGVTEGGKPAVTHFNLLEQLKTGSVVGLRLETGRTHQIRVHMNHLGHPLMGDDLYGGTFDHIKRQALHSQALEFTHPITMKRVHYEAPLPPDMADLIEELKP